MTDQKTPAQPLTPPGSGAAVQPKTAPALPKPPSAVKPVQAPPPLPKPNFSISSPAGQQSAVKPPAPLQPRPVKPLQPQTAPSSPQVRPISAQDLAKPAAAPVAQLGQSNADLPPTSSIRQAAKLPPTPGKPSGLSSVGAGSPSLPKPPSTTPPSTPPGQLPPPPKPAEFQKSPLRFLPLLIAFFLVLGIGYFLYSRFLAPRPTQTVNDPQTGRPTQQKADTVITYWGLWEPGRVLDETLKEFEQQNPGVKVNYQQQTYKDYRERLQTAIAGGRGPDVFRFHASWVPMLRAELSEVPATAYTPADYQQTFYPIVSEQLKLNNKYVGIPLMYEGLALFYNKEALRTANAEPPKSWTELKALASRLTIQAGGRMERAGLAIGNASNVDHFGEILGLLMLQNGADPLDPTSEKSQQALQYYIDFYTKDRVWDATLPNSTVAFARGEVAMIFAPSWRAHDIIALNPNLSFGVAQVPQVSSEKVTWASYWAEGVSSQSKNKEASWKLLTYLSSQEALLKLHSTASKERTFGQIYPRVDMANLLVEDEYSAPYLADAPFAKSWYLNTFTHDGGLNDQVLKYYEDAITETLTKGVKTEDALGTVAQGVRQVLRQYNLSK
jgi:multiple sugar transport system substrate-binding protein